MDGIILESLVPKIFEIKSQGKIPVIFILIGTYPGYSRSQQTPPLIEEYIANSNLAPIVILIDPAYKKTDWLAFLDEDYLQTHPRFLENINNINTKEEMQQPNVKPGVWYYPGLITTPGNNKSLNFRGKVPYQYYSQPITEGQLFNLAQNEIISDNLTLIWAFNNWTFNCGIIKINNRKFHIPDSDCMADVENDINYFPMISRDINGYYFRNRYNLIEEILPILKVETNEKMKKRLKGFVYNLYIKWLYYYSSIRRWELFVRFNDPSFKITVNKESPIKEWVHLHQRAGLSSYVTKIKDKFMKSPHQYFYEYINEEIYKMGCALINYECISLGDSTTLEVQIKSFSDEYFLMCQNNDSTMPQLFKFFEKKQDYLN